MSFEAWLEFRRGEIVDTRKPTCTECGAECSGDTTVTLDVDGHRGEVPVCDEGTGCS